MKSYGDPSYSLESVVPKETDETPSWFSLIRVTIFLAVMFAGVGVLYGIVLFAVPKGLDQFFEPTFHVLAYIWILAVALYFWGAVEHKTLPKMGLVLRGTDLLAGVAIGLSAILLLYGLELVLNLITLTPPLSYPIWMVFKVIAATLFIALLEEIVFRGYLLQTLLTDMPTPLAVGIASFLYAQIHFIQPGRAEFLFPFLGYLAAGLVLSYAYLLTRNLFLPMGLQGAWILFMQFSDSMGLWTYAHPWLTGNGSPVTGLLGIVTVGLIAGALRYVYGPINPLSLGRRSYRA